MTNYPQKHANQPQILDRNGAHFKVLEAINNFRMASSGLRSAGNYCPLSELSLTKSVQNVTYTIIDHIDTLIDISDEEGSIDGDLVSLAIDMFEESEAPIKHLDIANNFKRELEEILKETKDIIAIVQYFIETFNKEIGKEIGKVEHIQFAGEAYRCVAKEMIKKIETTIQALPNEISNIEFLETIIEGINLIEGPIKEIEATKNLENGLNELLEKEMNI